MHMLMLLSAVNELSFILGNTVLISINDINVWSHFSPSHLITIFAKPPFADFRGLIFSSVFYVFIIYKFFIVLALGQLQ